MILREMENNNLDIKDAKVIAKNISDFFIDSVQQSNFRYRLRNIHDSASFIVFLKSFLE